MNSVSIVVLLASVLSGTVTGSILPGTYSSDSYTAAPTGPHVPHAPVPNAYVPNTPVSTDYFPNAPVPNVYVPNAPGPNVFAPSAPGPDVFAPSTQVPTAYVPTASSAARQKIQSIALDPNSNQAKCPAPLTPCAIPIKNTLLSIVRSQSWECLNLKEELTSCGSCGNDCMALPNVGNVGCQVGACKIFSCANGYTLHQRMDGHSGRMVDVCI
ncbi:hypothetical protein PSTG_16690 [Puccinia striiformis f. sp. tritici PST-78]|uniref:Protein CPL1-like domain-containing protein n=1 Tax=Puccinia striiformis f. sp. tritici PST-78 TaxID=1165861 RepID=A0A0L0USG2_9BASI|nr:hypothetical protein PSTG_16690 [Puccinia striiformis f. sp. tritici PST-78]